MKTRIFLFAMLASMLVACQEEVSIIAPSPATMTAEALGHYCQMNVLEHDGPKAQIHLANSLHPIWFTQVRDAIAFTRLPEETAEVTAIYVNDMGKTENWRNPGVDNWIDAYTAFYVLESRKNGGMGAPEVIPFGTIESARQFIKSYGGKIVQFDEIPDDYILGPVEVNLSSLPAHGLAKEISQ